MTADGWTRCELGHTHWGRVGAAGLLLVHTDDSGTSRFLLQHRARIVQKGLTWGIPGGALGHGESPVAGALREASEEMHHVPTGLTHRTVFVDDHGGWAYHTVVMDSPEMPRVTGGWETGPDGYVWATAEVIEREKRLHPGFAGTWPTYARALTSD